MRSMRLTAVPLTLALVLAAGCDEAPAPADAATEVEVGAAPTANSAAEPQPAQAEQPSSQDERQPEDPPQPEAQPEEADQATAQSEPEAPRVRKSRVVRRYEIEAEGLRPLLESDAVKEFLGEVSLLNDVPTRRIFVRQGAAPDAVPEAEFHTLPDEIKNALRMVKIDTPKYYQTIYGSPLAYARPLDLVATHGQWDSFEGKKIFDFGYGQIGQLRLLAQCGAEVTGIDSSSMISAMYTLPGDTGEFTGTTGKTGNLRLYQGYWPAGQFARERVGTGYDLVMARNVLRKGPMDPDSGARPELRVTLRTSNEMFIARLNQALNMGGYAIVYNIGGAGQELWEQFPASDFSCPFTREQWESAGFEVIEDNTFDSEAMRDVGKALMLDRGPNGISLETQMYACYTLVKKVDEATIPGQAAPTDD